MKNNSVKFPVISIRALEKPFGFENLWTMLLLTVEWSEWDKELVSHLQQLVIDPIEVIHINMDEVLNFETLNSYFPNLPPPVEMPCIALYHGALLKVFVTGKDALVYAKAKWPTKSPAD